METPDAGSNWKMTSEVNNHKPQPASKGKREVYASTEGKRWMIYGNFE